jgi:hypothetical protein
MDAVVRPADVAGAGDERHARSTYPSRPRRPRPKAAAGGLLSGNGAGPSRVDTTCHGTGAACQGAHVYAPGCMAWCPNGLRRRGVPVHAADCSGPPSARMHQTSARRSCGGVTRTRSHGSWGRSPRGALHRPQARRPQGTRPCEASSGWGSSPARRVHPSAGRMPSSRSPSRGDGWCGMR